MLLQKAVLNRITRNEISVVYRRWRKPTVRSGGTLRTAVGVLNILAVREVRAPDIPRADVVKAGYATKTELLAELGARDGTIFRIALEYAGTDPRVALRQRDILSGAELDAVSSRLQRLDVRSPAGPWTERLLAAIEGCPNVAARVLATRLGCEKDWLKLQVRKLKNLGLTISHHPGYTLSQRGQAVLDYLRTAAPDHRRSDPPAVAPDRRPC